MRRSASATQAFSVKALRKYDIIYFRCAAYGFVQTEDSRWLDEAYTAAITDIDTGHVGRSISELVEGHDREEFRQDRKAPRLRWRVRPVLNLMRDRGFDFYWHDLLRDA